MRDLRGKIAEHVNPSQKSIKQEPALDWNWGNPRAPWKCVVVVGGFLLPSLNQFLMCNENGMLAKGRELEIGALEGHVAA
ncbi:hypothetical protein V6N13_079768 [Hibiscus sabdariffa]